MKLTERIAQEAPESDQEYIETRLKRRKESNPTLMLGMALLALPVSIYLWVKFFIFAFKLLKGIR